MTVPFVVYGLPRSRTYWLSRFLSYGPWTVTHDEIAKLRGLDDLKSWLGTELVGSCETAAAPFWRLTHKLRPDLKTVVIRRNPWECFESTIATGVEFDKDTLLKRIYALDHKLDQVEKRVPGVLSVSYHALSNPEVCREIFEHCLDLPWDHAWWKIHDGMKLVVNLPSQVRYFQANQGQIERLARVAKQSILADLTHRPANAQGFTFQQESIENVLVDGMWLLHEHAVQVGEPLDTWQTKNFDLMGKLEKMGVLHVTTARSNGKMFGYLVALVSPSLEQKNTLDGMHTSFYTSASTPGLAIKLQRAGVEFLRGRGVESVQFRAGHRGAGPRTGAMYRRLGAEEFGTLYRLPLKDVA